MSGRVIVAVFDGSWVLAHRTAEMLPIDRYKELLAQALSPETDYQVIKSNLTECHLELKSDADVAPILESLSKLIQAEFDISPDLFSLTVEEAQASDIPPEEETQAGSEPEPQGMPGRAKAAVSQLAETTESAMARIDALAGAEEFRDLCHELHRMRELLVKPEYKRAFLSQRYLFSINEGYGFEKSVELFGDLLQELGLFRFSGKKKARFFNFRQPEDANELKAQFESVRELYDKSNSFSGIVAIDISAWALQHINREFTGLLRQIAGLSEQFVTIFRLPYVEEHVIGQVFEVMSDVMNMRKITFPPPTREEHWQYAKAAMERCGWAVDEGLEPVFYTLLAREQQDGRFYGNDTVDKIVDQMLYRKLSRLSQGLMPENLISTEDIGMEEEQKTSKDAASMLDELIGIDEVKKQLLQIVAQIEAGREIFGEGSQPPCIHMRFTGNPGTGKTTVARILGKMLKERGVLSVGRFYEVSRADLCGRYVGETAPKTARVCRDALGSVLFIDEAYALSAYEGNRVDYGQEAIDTLVSFMENHRDQLVVIMAGYKEEMDDMLLRNAGLSSRMPYEIAFPNYTREDLYRMFLAGVHREFSYDGDFAQTVKDFFENITEEEYGKKTFGNGRLVRNLYERIWGKAVMRRRIDKGAPLTLIKDDAVLAINDREFRALISENANPRRIGFRD